MTTAERIKTLQKERDIAYSEYYKLATKPSTNPSKSDLEPLEKAIAKYETICEELNHTCKVEEVYNYEKIQTLDGLFRQRNNRLQFSS